MILVDANLLVYGWSPAAPEHARAREWLTQQARPDGNGFVLCWPVLYALVRLLSSPRIFGGDAVTVAEAWAVADAFVNQPAARVATAGPGHRGIAAELARTPGLRSQDVPDVEIAALAVEHGLVLATHDSGFRRFAGLRVVDPLADSPG